MRTLLVGLVVLAASGGIAAADKPTKDQIAQAKKLYTAAEAEVRSGKFAEAANDYTSAYELTKDTALLFKIASAHQDAGACDSAVPYYRRYLKEAAPSPKFVKLTKQRIAKCGAPVDEPVTTTPPLDNKALAAASKAFVDLVASSRGAIEDCYEQTLKRRSDLQSKTVTLIVSASFSSTGALQTSSVQPPLDASFDACMQDIASKWTLPASSAMTFKAPISLTPPTPAEVMTKPAAPVETKPAPPPPVETKPAEVMVKPPAASADVPDPGHARDTAWVYLGGAALLGGAGGVLYAQGNQTNSSGYKDAAYASFAVSGIAAIGSIYFFVRHDPHAAEHASLIVPTAGAHSAGVAALFRF